MRDGDAADDPAPGVIPCLVLRDPAAAADFYQAAFGAAVRERAPDGRSVGLGLGGSMLRLLAADRAAGLLGPESFGGAPVLFSIEVADLQAALARAVAHGAVVLKRPDETGREAILRDPFMHVWRLGARDPG
jgi:PhnB protein